MLILAASDNVMKLKVVPWQREIKVIFYIHVHVRMYT